MRNLCWRLGGFGKPRLSASRSLRSVTGTDCFVLSGSTSGRRRARQVKSSRLGTLTSGRCAEGARSDCIFGGRARAGILARPAAHGGSIRDLRSGRQWPPGALKVVVAGYPVGPEPGGGGATSAHRADLEYLAELGLAGRDRHPLDHDMALLPIAASGAEEIHRIAERGAARWLSQTTQLQGLASLPAASRSAGLVTYWQTSFAGAVGISPDATDRTPGPGRIPGAS